MPDPVERKVLFVAWGAAEWELVAPLLESGRLPQLARLVEGGVLARLDGWSPAASVPLWTSVATGRRPDVHGVAGNFEPAGAGVAPISARWRRGLPVWEICARHERPAVVVDWPASAPAEERPGLVVVERDAVTPARWAADVAALRVRPEEFTRDDLRSFVAGIDALEPAREAPLAQLMRWLARSAGTQAVATYLLENEPWRFAAVHFGALGEIFRHFVDYTAPQLPQIGAAEFERYRRVIEEALVLHDTMLGRLVAAAGPDATIVVGSEHGWLTGARRPALAPGEHAHNVARETSRGWAVLRGPGLKADELIYGGTVLDLAPTVLWRLGLAVPRDWPGKVWYHAATQPVAAAAIDTHEPAPLAPPAVPDLATAAGRELHYAQGCHLLRAGRAAEAVPILEAMHAALQPRIGPGLMLINAYVALRRFGEARALLEELAARPEGGLLARPGLQAKYPPQFEFIRGVVAEGEGRWEEAQACFELALAAGAHGAELHAKLGGVHLERRRWAPAKAAFARAVELEPESAPARFGLALAHYRLRDFAAAAEEAMAAATFRTEPAEYHLLLGRALARIGQREQAVVALRHALARRPNLLLAHRLLVVLHRQNPAESVLLETHRAAVRHLTRS